MAGTVEAVGENVTRFEPGDEVFGQGLGTLAEYAAVSEQGLVAKPGRLTMEQAAAVPVAGLTALQGLRDWGDMEQGDRVLVNGASGGVGTFAVQIARALGAEVTAVCSSRNVAQAEEIGATRVVDYTREDFTELAERFDVFFDGPGNRPLSECSRMLEPDGTYVMIGGPKGVWVSPMPRLVAMKLRSLLTGMNTGNGTARRVLGDLMILRDLLESGQINPVIDRNYKLEEAIDALTYQGTFHAMGKIVVTV